VEIAQGRSRINLAVMPKFSEFDVLSAISDLGRFAVEADQKNLVLFLPRHSLENVGLPMCLA
jgi:hypothetical protein